MTDEHLRYPIGRFQPPITFTPEDIRKWMNDIKVLPGRLRHAVMNLTEAQLDTPYRLGGWTLRQVVHHLADSHTSSILRFKWALTEDRPTIKAYDEKAFALLPDYKLPIEPSLKMLEGIHQRLTALFESFNEDDWDRAFLHPETGATLPLKKTLALYAWHGKHHLAHITETAKRF